MILIEELVFFQEMIVILGTYLSQIYLSKLDFTLMVGGVRVNPFIFPQLNPQQKATLEL